MVGRLGWWFLGFLFGRPPQLRRVIIGCIQRFAFGVRLRAPWELEEVPMPIVGGLDIHRKQITFDYLEVESGQVECGQIAPADRVHPSVIRVRRV